MQASFSLLIFLKLMFIEFFQKYYQTVCKYKVCTGLKRTGKSLKSIEKSLNSTIFCRTVDRDLNQYKIVVPLFGAAYDMLHKI